METIRDREDGHVAHKGRGIFLVYVDIEAKDAKEFNEWYNTEHLPELLAVPGILAAARYEAVKGGPKYLACYELENVEVMHTPGHSPGGVCLDIPELGVVVTGDTLFKGGPGATGRSHSDFETILASIRTRLLVLPPETRVLPGHGEETTIFAEGPSYDEWVRRGH